MSFSITHDNRGIAPLAIVLSIAVIAVIAGAGYTVVSKQNNTDTSNSVADSITDAAQQAAINCEIDDKDICKFYASWKENDQYRMTSKSTEDGQTSTFIYEYSDGGNKSYVKMDGDMSMESITINDVVYTKAGNTWWKQAVTTPDLDDGTDIIDDIKPDFEEPKDEPEADRTAYKKLGKEACGNLQCFKYEITDPTSQDSKEFIWFDDQEYQLRQGRSESGDLVSEYTVEYSGIDIKEPSPVKELGPNQYIMPGSNEPMTMPDMSQSTN